MYIYIEYRWIYTYVYIIIYIQIETKATNITWVWGHHPLGFCKTRMFLWDEDPGHLSASMKQLGKFYIWVMEDGFPNHLSVIFSYI